MFYMAELYIEKYVFKHNQDQRKLFNEATQNAYKEWKQNPSKLWNNVNLRVEERMRQLFKALSAILWFYWNNQINRILTNEYSLRVSDRPETGKKNNCILQTK